MRDMLFLPDVLLDTGTYSYRIQVEITCRCVSMRIKSTGDVFLCQELILD